jgi:hypothetical protein
LKERSNGPYRRENGIEDWRLLGVDGSGHGDYKGIIWRRLHRNFQRTGRDYFLNKAIQVWFVDVNRAGRYLPNNVLIYVNAENMNAAAGDECSGGEADVSKAEYGDVIKLRLRTGTRVRAVIFCNVVHRSLFSRS